MENKQFSFDSVLGFGWRTMTKNIWFFVGIFLTILVVSYTPVVIQLLIEHSSMEKSIVNTLNYTIMVISQIINFIITIGLIKIALSFCDEVKPTFSTLFDFWGCFWRYVGGAVLYILIIIAGYLLLIVPGVI